MPHLKCICLAWIESSLEDGIGLQEIFLSSRRFLFPLVNSLILGAFVRANSRSRGKKEKLCLHLVFIYILGSPCYDYDLLQFGDWVLFSSTSNFLAQCLAQGQCFK